MDFFFNIKDYEFLIHFCIGGILATICFYCSKNNKTKLLAILPAMPTLGIYALLLTIKDNNDYNMYLITISKSILLAFVFYILILLIDKVIKKILVSLLISLIIWFFLTYKIILC